MFLAYFFFGGGGGSNCYNNQGWGSGFKAFMDLKDRGNITSQEPEQ